MFLFFLCIFFLSAAKPSDLGTLGVLLLLLLVVVVGGGWTTFGTYPCAAFQRCVQKLPDFFYPLKTQVTLWRGVFKSCQIFSTHLPSNISRNVFKKVCSKRCVQRGVLNTPLEILFLK